MESEAQLQMQTKPKLFCFVLMPFTSDFDDVYQIGIKEACDIAGAYCERVDEQIFSERILDRIYNQIAKSDVVIADMTSRNANVFYEVGYAHALGKPTVLLTRNADDIPFDLKHFPHIVYETKLSLLRDKLSKVVAWHAAHPRIDLEETKFPISLRVDGLDPIKDEICLVKEADHHWVDLRIAIGNQGGVYLEEDDYRIGVIDGCHISSVGLGANSYGKAPMLDGRNQFVLPSFGSLMPDEFSALSFTLFIYDVTVPGPHKLTLRIFTKTSMRDFELTWKQIDNASL